MGEAVNVVDFTAFDQAATGMATRALRYQERRRAKRTAIGLCRECPNKAVVGRTLCEACRSSQRLKHAATRAADVASRAVKYCASCGDEIGKDYKPKGGKPRRFCVKCPHGRRLRLKTMPRIQRCCECGSQFTQSQKQATCSRACAGRLRARRMLGRKLAPYIRKTVERACAHCGVPVLTTATRGVCSQCKRANKSAGGDACRRARRKGLPRDYSVTPVKVLERDGYTCQLCGVKTPKRLRGTFVDRAPEVDHIIPLAAGGGHTWDNVQCACRKCNQEKGAKPLGQPRLIA